MNKKSILLVDDQVEILNALERLLKGKYNVLRSDSGKEALEILKKNPVQVIVSDQRMPVMTGVEFLENSIKIRPEAIKLLITAYADINASISAVNKGQIYYYISKPWEDDELLLIIQRAFERYELIEQNKILNEKLLKINKQLETENVLLKKNIQQQYDFSNIIGHSHKMLEVFKLASKVIDTPTTVMIYGETGTGKEMLANAIHYNSNRKDKMFVAQNCGAFSETLLESELFGHVKGAFTGAVNHKKGLFEIADGGTVFLDEIADTTPAFQTKLLRVLQEGEIKPVGSEKSKKIDVRIIAATNKNLEEESNNGNFRKDLYYRLNVFPITLPPLNERTDDIEDLVHFFIEKFSQRINKKIKSISEEALTLLQHSDFPGNVRELENEIERAVTIAEPNSNITKEILSPRFQNKSVIVSKTLIGNADLKAQVETLEITLISQALDKTNGNILKAAELLGISRQGLHKKLNRYHNKM